MRILAASALALLLTAVARGETAPPTLRRIGPEGGSIIGLARAPLADAPLFTISAGGELFRLDTSGHWQSVARDIGVVVPDPNDARVVYALRQYHGRLLRSRDGGTTWAADTGLNAEDPAGLILVPSSGTAYASSAGVVFRSRDGLRSWVAVLGRQTEDEYATVQLSLGTLPKPVIYAHLPGVSLQRSEDDGATWIGAALPNPQCSSHSDYCTAIRVDPRDARRLLIGVGSTIYRSTDAGDTWQLATITNSGSGSGAGFLNISDIAIDPSDSQRAYAGRDTGLLVSEDGGAQWQQSTTGPDATEITRLLIDPTDPLTLYVGSGDFYGYAEGGIQVSHDRGQSWLPMNRGLYAYCVTAMTVVSPDTIFTGTCSFDGTVLLTTNAGQTWRSARQGLPKNTRLEALAVVGGDRLDEVFAGLEYDGIYRSEDAGAHWLPTNVGEWSVSDLALGSGATPLLYAAVGNDGVWASGDGGASWDPADTGLPIGGGLGQVDRIVADPADPLRAYAIVNFSSTTIPLFRTLDGGQHWGAVGSTLPTGLYDDVAVSAADPFQLYAARSDDTVYGSGDRGDSWYRTGLSESYPGYIRLAADPIWPATVYATTLNGRILRSDDRGDTWQVLVRDLDFGGASPLVAVGEPRTLFLQTFNQGVITYGPLPPPNVGPACAGDCNGDRAISIAELVTSVNIAIGYDSVGICPRADANDDDDVSIDELIRAVAAALSGCA